MLFGTAAAKATALIDRLARRLAVAKAHVFSLRHDTLLVAGLGITVIVEGTRV
jgi:hypothetical protein